MRVVSELVLARVDEKLVYELVDLGTVDVRQVHIIRFRDDYRIFCNDPMVGERVLNCLSDILLGFGMKLSAQKTSRHTDIIGASIKEDKRYWANHSMCRTLEDELLAIRELSERYPNSGSVVRALSDCYRNIDDFAWSGEPRSKVAIVCDIMKRSPQAYPLGSALLSDLLPFCNYGSQRTRTCDALMRQFRGIPDSSLLFVWLQRLFFPDVYALNVDERLVQMVQRECDYLWDVSWMKGNLLKAMQANPIVRNDKIATMGGRIDTQEVCLLESEYI